MRISRLLTSISCAVSSSCSTREKYSGVNDSREAITDLLTGGDTLAAPALAQSSGTRRPNR